MRNLITIICMSFFALGISAQKLSLTANISAFSIDKPTIDDPLDWQYKGTTFSHTLGINARLFSQKKWALRLGAEREDLRYTIGEGSLVDSLYNVNRRDFMGIIGVEKHIMIADWVTIYPGLFTGITFPGKQDLSDELYDINRDKLRAGLGVLLGANIKLLKFLRIGMEFDMKYDNFKTQVWNQIGVNTSAIRLRNLDYTGAFTIGVAF